MPVLILWNLLIYVGDEDVLAMVIIKLEYDHSSRSLGHGQSSYCRLEC